MRQILFAMAAALAPGAALACQITHVPTPESAAAADYVVAGRVIDYLPEAWDSFARAPRYALLRMEVSEVWKGEVGDVFELVLTDDTMPLPRDWDWPQEIILVAMDPKNPGKAPRDSLPQAGFSICAMPLAVLTDESRAAFRDYFSAAE